MWWSDAEWAALIDPEACGMCADAHLDENAHSVLVVSTSTAHVRLVRNQAHPGYCVVILREHLTDMTDLGPAARAAFWSDVQRTGSAVASVFCPRKVDYLVMGHRMPHLHCHVFPQHDQDDPLRNVDISDGPVVLATGELEEWARRLRAAWSSVG
ncbi:HIT family protein [Microbacterium arabinogalactanolyticum]|uniref:HIT family protein n=1 Tax=Microbacterium arabinogalactanolyticum TaxID=69365 RepID=UPI002552255D|nr:HIT family protein [Microbacterium arabinogalactanolyticum]GLC86218.1 hypothetical protein MIAR_28030 [Microbacterium arabinogalactanolyticum]